MLAQNLAGYSALTAMAATVEHVSVAAQYWLTHIDSRILIGVGLAFTAWMGRRLFSRT
jgi:hypothetical protein